MTEKKMIEFFRAKGYQNESEEGEDFMIFSYQADRDHEAYDQGVDRPNQNELDNAKVVLREAREAFEPFTIKPEVCDEWISFYVYPF